jgi:flagellar biosynthesis activator protein FlaF
MYANQLEVYRSVQKTTMSDREIEASVLMKAAAKLKYCQDNWDAADRTEKLDEALKFNQLLWSIFQAELSKDDNPMPLQIRQDILSLSLFIDKRILEVMAYPLMEKLSVIININMNIAAGLKGSTC